jgi:ACR3 family arsenite efflux pump ArsB
MVYPTMVQMDFSEVAKAAKTPNAMITPSLPIRAMKNSFLAVLWHRFPKLLYL